MAIDRSAIVSYANTYWYQPCKDGKAWLANEPVIIANEAQPGDLVVCLGAGDITTYANGLAEKLSAPAAE